MAQVISAVNFADHHYIVSDDPAHCSLPEGFKFLVTDQMELVEPVLLYLYEKCVLSARIQSVGNTQEAYCADLYEWWSFLEEACRPWNEVTPKDLVHYRDALLNSFSPHTRRRYAPATVRRRLTVILDFYNWAYAKGYFDEPLDEPEFEFVPSWLDAGTRPRPSHEQTKASSLLPKAYENVINAFNPSDLLAVLNRLGPELPMEDPPTEHRRPLRDRLVATTSLATGMRLDEVLSLALHQVLDLRPSSDEPDELLKLRITKTKGLMPRDVFLPLWLHRGFVWYVNRERKRSVEAAWRYRNEKPKRITGLFVNGADANHRDVGNPLTSHTFERTFRKVVMGLGLVRRNEHLHAETGKLTLEQVPAHTPHDLRHTFAVQAYFARVSRGDAEPWKTLQVLLGHKYVSTTVDTYLRSMRLEEARLSDTLSDYFKTIRYG